MERTHCMVSYIDRDGSPWLGRSPGNVVNVKVNWKRGFVGSYGFR